MTTALAVRDQSVIEQAFALALPSPQVEGAIEELESLSQAYRTLLPVEETSKNKLEQRINELRQTVTRAEFPEDLLPMEPLSWRWKNGLPKMALLTIGYGATFTISAGRSGSRLSSGVTPDLPWELESLYSDVVKLAESYCVRRDSRRSFSFTFEGVIPMSVRESIVKAQKSLRFEGLYMLVEAPEKAWKVESVKGISRAQAAREYLASIELDPLVLGYAQEALWVIDKFDLTTLEQYVLDEFSQKALTSGE